MKVLAIALLNLRRMFKDRTNVFFVLVAPFLLILVLGQLFGGGQQLRLGVVAEQGAMEERLVSALGSGGRVAVERIGSERELRDAVEQGLVNAGVVVPSGYGASLRAGRPVTVRSLVRAAIDPRAHDVAAWVRAVVPQESVLVRAAQSGDGSFDTLLAKASATEVPGIQVRVAAVGSAVFPEGIGAFSISAPPQLLMFVFFTSLTAAIGLVETRMLGISRRMYAGPTRAATIVLGEALGRIVIALVQGVTIMAGSALLFDVGWGDPVAAVAVLVLFSLVGAGAAMLLGSLFRTPGPPSSLAMILGLGLAAFGGSMMPLESFGGVLRTLAHLTPHAWGYDAFAQLIRHGAGLGEVAPQLGVLAGFAAVLFALGTWRLRRALTS